MSERTSGRVAIVDYGMGNLFSVRRACEHVGIHAMITSSKQDMLNAAAVILPGVGAFGVAMGNLARLDLIGLLCDVAASGKPLIGICLGMQLLMTKSHEFGSHRGLNILEGEVVRLDETMEAGRRLKVPQVGWNRVHAMSSAVGGASAPPWKSTLLDGLSEGQFMYFVHSFYCQPTDPDVGLSATRYGAVEFCSSVHRGNVFGCQFHPERSGPLGLQVYRNLAAMIHQSESEEQGVRKAGSQIRFA